MVKKVDQAVGELTTQLRTNNLTERVNIIVISDHGKGIIFRYLGGVLHMKVSVNQGKISKLETIFRNYPNRVFLVVLSNDYLKIISPRSK